MIDIEVKVRGEGPQDKVAGRLRDGLKDQMSATPWKMRIVTEDGDTVSYTNEGRKPLQLQEKANG